MTDEEKLILMSFLFVSFPMPQRSENEILMYRRHERLQAMKQSDLRGFSHLKGAKFERDMRRISQRKRMTNIEVRREQI